MSVTVSYDETRRWVLVRVTGMLTIEEAVRVINTARADITYSMWPMLFDARSATTAMSEDDVEEAIEAVRRVTRTERSRGHVALVAEDEVFYDRMLYYEARCADLGVTVIRAFRTVVDAERWLEIVSAARYFR